LFCSYSLFYCSAHAHGEAVRRDSQPAARLQGQTPNAQTPPPRPRAACCTLRGSLFFSLLFAATWGSGIWRATPLCLEDAGSPGAHAQLRCFWGPWGDPVRNSVAFEASGPRAGGLTCSKVFWGVAQQKGLHVFPRAQSRCKCAVQMQVCSAGPGVPSRCKCTQRRYKKKYCLCVVAGRCG
jgi:hypothetical protein